MHNLDGACVCPDSGHYLVTSWELAIDEESSRTRTVEAQTKCTQNDLSATYEVAG